MAIGSALPNCSIFWLIDAVLLKPLPYAQPGELVQLRNEARSSDAMIESGDLYASGPD